MRTSSRIPTSFFYELSLLMFGLALVLFLGALSGCAAEIEGEEQEEIGLQTDALVNGCWDYLSIKSQAPGTIYSPYSTGRVWDFIIRSGNFCYYSSGGIDYLYSAQTYPGNCGQYDAKTWYCSGAGVFTCPATATLARPNGGSDNAFGPYSTFNRHYPSYGSGTVLPFTHSYWDNGSKRVVCGYQTNGAQYRYSLQVF